MKLTQQQIDVFEQIKAFLRSDATVFILRGYAGTGKTTLVKAIVDHISREHTVRLMAPTGRAARILSAKTGYMAKTIHRSIYMLDRFAIKEEDIAEKAYKIYFSIRRCDRTDKFVAIVDEASMVCSRKIEHELFAFGTDNLMNDLLTFTCPSLGGKIIFVGDPAQLPPVGEDDSNALRGDFFKNLGLKVMESELTEVLRQDDDSLRWAYTATTRARKTLYYTNLPKVTPFSKFDIQPIERCRKMDAECRIIDDYPATPYHDHHSKNFLRAKYYSIVESLKNTPYKIEKVESKPYLEIYYIHTPSGVDRFDLIYKNGGIFSLAKAVSKNIYSEEIRVLLDDESFIQCKPGYQPSDEVHEQLCNLIHSACDEVGVKITNIVEHKEDYSVVFYLWTSKTYSYIKIYINNKGFVTYAKPMSFAGAEDNELNAVISEVNKRMK